MRFGSATLCAFAALVTSACDDATAPLTGAIRIELTTTGVDLDADGYNVRVDQGAIVPIAINSSLIVPGLRPGRRTVSAGGWAPNCWPQNSAQRFVEVVASDTVDVTFAVVCAANVGAIIVLPDVTGVDPDPDGYLVSLDGQPEVPVSTFGAFLQQVPVGSHTLTLSGLANNCSVQQATITVTVTYGTSAQARHAVSCAERLGGLLVNAITSGADPDDRYDVDVEGIGAELPANGSATLNSVHEGLRTVTLRGVNPNCTVTGANPRQIPIEYKATAQITFEVECVAAAKIRVTASTTGVDPDLTYRIRIQGPGVDRSDALAANSSITVGGMGPGEHIVTLEDVAVNCEVAASPPNPHTVSTAAATTTDIAFNIACAVAKQIAYVQWHNGNNSELFASKSNGTSSVQLTATNAEEHDPAYSPDGSRIAFRSYRDGNSDIYVMNADGSGVQRLTTHTAGDMNPEWSPDGTKIAFRSNRDGNDEIYVMNADGSNITRLTNNSAFDAKPTWSPDGSKIAFMSDRTGGGQIFVMSADGSNVTQLTNTSWWNGLPAWSPDGTKIAFVREVECDDYYYYCHNIFVMNADGSGVVRHETRSHDSEPAWSADGKWIAFETRYCDYYSCSSWGIAAIKSDGKGRTSVLSGEVFNPTWRP